MFAVLQIYLDARCALDDLASGPVRQDAVEGRRNCLGAITKRDAVAHADELQRARASPRPAQDIKGVGTGTHQDRAKARFHQSSSVCLFRRGPL